MITYNKILKDILGEDNLRTLLTCVLVALDSYEASNYKDTEDFKRKVKNLHALLFDHDEMPICRVDMQTRFTIKADEESAIRLIQFLMPQIKSSEYSQMIEVWEEDLGGEENE